MNHKHAFLFRILLFLAIFGLCFFVLDSLFYKEATLDTPTIEAMINAQEKLDIIIIGSSHAYASFDPHILEDILDHSSTTNLSASELNSIQSLFVLNAIIDQGKIPNVVVLELFSSQYDLSNTHQIQFFNDFSNTWHWKYLMDYLRYQRPEQYIAGGLFPLIDQHEHWKTPQLIEDNIHKYFSYDRSTLPSAEIFDQHGYRPLHSIITMEAYQEALMGPVDANPYKGNLQAYQDILALRDEYGFKVLFVYSPFPMAYQSDLSQLDAMMQTLGEPYYNLNIGAQESFSAYDYFDDDHTNSIGAIKTSISLAQILSDELSRPLDQARIDLYQELYLSGISSHWSGRDLVVELSLPGKDAAEYDLVWRLYKDGKPVLKATADDQLSYQIPQVYLAGGIDRVECTLSTPELAYSIRLRFDPYAYLPTPP